MNGRDRIDSSHSGRVPAAVLQVTSRDTPLRLLPDTTLPVSVLPVVLLTRTPWPWLPLAAVPFLLRPM